MPLKTHGLIRTLKVLVPAIPTSSTAMLVSFQLRRIVMKVLTDKKLAALLMVLA